MADVTRLDPIDGPRAPKINYTRPSSPRTRLDNSSAPPTNLDGGTPTAYLRERLPPGLDARFTMVRPLGDGAEASVWLCTDEKGNEVAVKLYRHEPKYALEFGSEQYRTHFPPEVAVQLLEAPGMDHGVHYELMELCRFGTLESYLADRGGFGTNKHAVEILTQIADAIHGMQGTAGSNRLVHGDIKPKNILVRTDIPLDLVLADFGLTVDLGDRSRLTNLGLGTIAFNAPELMRYKTTAADWWSLGMVMYQVLLGRGYFQLDNGSWIDNRTIESHLLSRDVSLSELDDSKVRPEHLKRWRMLLAGLLTRDPDVRWGMPEIKSWLDNKSPKVHRPLDDAARGDEPAVGQPAVHLASTSYALPGVGEFFDAAKLGAAMSSNPEVAARSLAGKGRQRLIDWLTGSARTGETYSEVSSHGSKWGPDELVPYFVARLAPAADLIYQSCNISSPSRLRKLADSNGNDDAIEKLYDHDLLGCINSGKSRASYKMIDANWHDIAEQAIALARSKNIPLESSARSHIIRQSLLIAASDDAVVDEFVRQVRSRIDGPQFEFAGETPWFARLRSEAQL
ncbi:protein kinase domain-containing protein [Rhodococcoides navarretei]|uniref:Protein kinase n=1 Tax=Rhodococcus navarretei TaxID=3128981 RepID=A0ABU9CVX2_9NOCA